MRRVDLRRSLSVLGVKGFIRFMGAWGGEGREEGRGGRRGGEGGGEGEGREPNSPRNRQSWFAAIRVLLFLGL